MNYDAKQIYNQANSFLAASNELNKKLSETNDLETYLAPIITNTAFCIELYLKCIYMIEKGQPIQGHLLDKLYRRLSKESRDSISVIYELLIQRSESDMFLKQKVPSAKFDLDSVLEGMSNAFIKWRYMHEGKGITSFAGSGPVIDALRNRIKELKPDW